uniref:Uncharacterized protein n=1 Tax=Leersia perrieri TaxID=77586 RepID=A0A0D9W2L9_9ORYZ
MRPDPNPHSQLLPQSLLVPDDDGVLQAPNTRSAPHPRTLRVIISAPDPVTLRIQEGVCGLRRRQVVSARDVGVTKFDFIRELRASLFGAELWKLSINVSGADPLTPSPPTNVLLDPQRHYIWR